MDKINQQLKHYQWIMVIFFFVMGYYMSWTETDFYFLLATGRTFVHEIPHTEFLSMHEGLHYVSQQWLFARALYQIYELAGYTGCYVLVAILKGLTQIIAYRMMIHITKGHYLFSTAAALLIMIPGAIFNCARPFTASTLLLLITVCIYESYMEGKNRIWILPVLSVLLINIHASMWPMMFVFMLPYLVGNIPIGKKAFLQFEDRNVLPLLGWGAVSAAAGLLNPYGIKSMLYLTYSYGYDTINNYIGEMQPATIKDLTGILILMFWLIGFWRLYKVRQVKARYAFLFAGTGLLALMHLRGLLLFTYIGILAVASTFEYRGSKKDVPAPKHFRIIQILLLILLVFTVISKDTTPELQNYQKAVNYIVQDTENKEDTTVFIGYAEGGYAEWMGLRPYIDPRAEVYLKGMNKKADILDEYMDTAIGHINVEKFMDKYKFDYVMIQKNGAIYYQMKYVPEYQKIYDNSDYIVYKLTS